ncbi:uncharacterized protein LOC144556933 isoform X2 [Carex rostrata]
MEASSFGGEKCTCAWADEWFTQFMLNGDRDFGRRLPVFENLKRFDFCGRPDGFNWVLGLVHNLSECPVLEELYFRLNCMWSRKGTAADDDDLNPDGYGDVLATKILEELEKDVPFVSPLKKVTIEDFTGEVAITTLVQFLLYRASLLESVVLYHCKHDVNIKRGVTRARKKMLNVQKASPSVKIAIIDSSTFCDGSISEKQPRQTLH